MGPSPGFLRFMDKYQNVVLKAFKCHFNTLIWSLK